MSKLKNLILVINAMASKYSTEFGEIHDGIKNTHDHGPNPIGIDCIRSVIVDDSGEVLTDEEVNEVYFGVGATSRSNRYYNKSKLSTDWETLIRNKTNRGLLYSRLIALDAMKDYDPETTWVRYYDASDLTKCNEELGSYDKFPGAFGLNDLLYDETIDYSTIKWKEVGVTDMNTNALTLSGSCKDSRLIIDALETGVLDEHCWSKVYRLNKLIKVRDSIYELYGGKDNIPNIFHRADYLINRLYATHVENFRSVSTQEILYYHNPGGQSSTDPKDKIESDENIAFKALNTILR